MTEALGSVILPTCGHRSYSTGLPTLDLQQQVGSMRSATKIASVSRASAYGNGQRHPTISSSMSSSPWYSTFSVCGKGAVPGHEQQALDRVQASPCCKCAYEQDCAGHPVRVIVLQPLPHDWSTRKLLCLSLHWSQTPARHLGVAQPAQFVEVGVTCSYSPKMHTPASVPVLHWRWSVGTRSFDGAPTLLGLLSRSHSPRNCSASAWLAAALERASSVSPFSSTGSSWSIRYCWAAAASGRGSCRWRQSQMLGRHKDKGRTVRDGSGRSWAGLGCCRVWQKDLQA